MRNSKTLALAIVGGVTAGLFLSRFSRGGISVEEQRLAPKESKASAIVATDLRSSPLAEASSDPTQRRVAPRDDEVEEPSGERDQAATDDPWKRAWREPGTTIEDLSELQLANIAIFRQELVKAVDQGVNTWDVYRLSRIVVHQSVAGIMESLGQGNVADLDGAAHVTVTDPDTSKLWVNGRYYLIERGRFSILDRLRAIEDLTRPDPRTGHGGNPEAAQLSAAEVSQVLGLADEALGWLSRD